MKLYKEWSPKLNDRVGRMVSTKALNHLVESQRDPGWASVYMFDEVSASEIRASGSSRGLSKYHVYAEQLAMDIDSGAEGLSEVERVLSSEDLGYEVWSSGGKGFHVFLPHALKQSIHLPHSHKIAIIRFGLEKVVDTTLYQHARLLSLPGRVHQKTGKRKEFMYAKTGRSFDLEIVEAPTPVFDFSAMDDMEQLEGGLLSLQMLVGRGPSDGHRHTRLWSTALSLADAGLSYEVTLELLQKVNQTWENPKESEEVQVAVSQAYQRNTRLSAV